MSNPYEIENTVVRRDLYPGMSRTSASPDGQSAISPIQALLGVKNNQWDKRYGYGRTVHHDQIPELFKDQELFTGLIVKGLITAQEDFIEEIAPIVETDAMYIRWDILEYGDATLGLTPYETGSREMTMSSRTFKATVKRRGLAMSFEMDALRSSKGPKLVQDRVVMFVSAIKRTLRDLTLAKCMIAPGTSASRIPESSEYSGDIDSFLRHEVEQFAFHHRRPEEQRSILIGLIERLRALGAASFALIVTGSIPPELHKQFFYPARSLENPISPMDADRGLSSIPADPSSISAIGPFKMYANPDVAPRMASIMRRNILRSNSRITEHYHMNWDHLDQTMIAMKSGTKGLKDFLILTDPQYRTIWVKDDSEGIDNFVQLKFSDAVTTASDIDLNILNALLPRLVPDDFRPPKKKDAFLAGTPRSRAHPYHLTDGATPPTFSTALTFGDLVLGGKLDRRHIAIMAYGYYIYHTKGQVPPADNNIGGAVGAPVLAGIPGPVYYHTPTGATLVKNTFDDIKGIDSGRDLEKLAGSLKTSGLHFVTAGPTGKPLVQPITQEELLDMSKQPHFQLAKEKLDYHSSKALFNIKRHMDEHTEPSRSTTLFNHFCGALLTSGAEDAKHIVLGASKTFDEMEGSGKTPAERFSWLRSSLHKKSDIGSNLEAMRNKGVELKLSASPVVAPVFTTLNADESLQKSINGDKSYHPEYNYYSKEPSKKSVKSSYEDEEEDVIGKLTGTSTKSLGTFKPSGFLAPLGFGPEGTPTGAFISTGLAVGAHIAVPAAWTPIVNAIADDMLGDASWRGIVEFIFRLPLDPHTFTELVKRRMHIPFSVKLFRILGQQVDGSIFMNPGREVIFNAVGRDHTLGGANVDYKTAKVHFTLQHEVADIRPELIYPMRHARIKRYTEGYKTDFFSVGDSDKLRAELRKRGSIRPSLIPVLCDIKETEMVGRMGIFGTGIWNPRLSKGGSVSRQTILRDFSSADYFEQLFGSTIAGEILGNFNPEAGYYTEYALAPFSYQGTQVSFSSRGRPEIYTEGTGHRRGMCYPGSARDVQSGKLLMAIESVADAVIDSIHY